MNTKIINTENATIEWVGKKILGSHNGTIEFKEGFYNFVEDQLVGGEFLVDMTTITVTDLSGDMKNQLEDTYIQMTSLALLILTPPN